jgi:mono/diheme cytochrome c family protein
VKHLSNPNGWWRDTAQRLLVERNDQTVFPELAQLATNGPGAVTRLHALWTLDALKLLKPPTLEMALSDREGKVRAAAIRLAEPALKPTSVGSNRSALPEKVFALAADTNADVQIQLALSLTQAPPDERTKATVEALAGNATGPLAREVASFALASLEPAKAAPAAVAKARPLTSEEKRRFDAGKTMYEATCLACHQQHGLGQPGLAPPLVDSEWVSGSEQRLIRIVLHGLRGPIKVKGESYEMDMPALGVLDDEQIAAALTYIRREWGHAFEPVTPDAVKKVRAQTETREDAWTAAELMRLP